MLDVDKEMNHTNFRRCDRFQGFLRPANADESGAVQMLHCPGQGVKGRKVFVRDDRMKGIQELKLCEVKVFGIPMERGQQYIKSVTAK